MIKNFSKLKRNFVKMDKFVILIYKDGNQGMLTKDII
jgi:hypothetical protein